MVRGPKILAVNERAFPAGRPVSLHPYIFPSFPSFLPSLRQSQPLLPQPLDLRTWYIAYICTMYKQNIPILSGTFASKVTAPSLSGINLVTQSMGLIVWCWKTRTRTRMRTNTKLKRPPSGEGPKYLLTWTRKSYSNANFRIRANTCRLHEHRVEIHRNLQRPMAKLHCALWISLRVNLMGISYI